MPASGKLIKRVLASATITLAALIALVSLAPPLTTPGLFIAIGVFIPGAWWFFCESKDKRPRQRISDAHKRRLIGMSTSIPSKTKLSWLDLDHHSILLSLSAVAGAGHFSQLS